MTPPQDTVVYFSPFQTSPAYWSIQKVHLPPFLKWTGLKCSFHACGEGKCALWGCSLAHGCTYWCHFSVSRTPSLALPCPALYPFLSSFSFFLSFFNCCIGEGGESGHKNATMPYKDFFSKLWGDWERLPLTAQVPLRGGRYAAPRRGSTQKDTEANSALLSAETVTCCKSKMNLPCDH